MTELLDLIRDAIRRPWYYANYAWRRSFRHLSSRGYFSRTVFAKASHALGEYDSIVFMLGHRMMHIGDQLFFLPLIHKLSAAGYPVTVLVGENLSFAFPPELRQPKPGARRLYVSRLAVLPSIWLKGGISTDYYVVEMGIPSLIPEPVGLFIIRSFFSIFDGSHEEAHLTELEKRKMIPNLPLPPKFNDLAGRHAIIMANYIDSGKHMISSKTIQRLVGDAASHKQNKEVTVVHLGTSHDKQDDPMDYSGFVDVDLRGRTSIADIFALLHNLKVEMVYTCDTAILHIARLYGLPTTIYFKTETTKFYADYQRVFGHFFQWEEGGSRDGVLTTSTKNESAQDNS